jgi:hypothetical protein
VALVAGNTIHDGMLVVVGANNCLRDLGGSHSPIFTDFMNHTQNFENRQVNLMVFLDYLSLFFQSPNQNWLAPNLEICIQA